MNLKVNYNIKAISNKDIILPTEVINSGTPFDFKDAYKEGNMVFIGVKTNQGIQEAGFIIPKGKRIKNRDNLKAFIESIIIIYNDDITYKFIDL